MNLNPAQQAQLLTSARVLVAQTFYGQMLKQMRSSPFKSEMFDGGRGGQAFMSQLDQHLAERMSRSSAGERLARAIVRKFEGKPHVQATDRT
jgi:Rod binding domain-containing protein